MKRIICAALALFTVLSVLPVLLISKAADTAYEDEIIGVLGALEIMNGDQNGNLNLENDVTRAEFTKMLVCASIYKDDAQVALATSPFPDVSASHWAAPYVKIAVAGGVVSGYLDGNFRPENKVTLEEAATLVLRMLGYTDSDFVGAYPDGQLAKYRSVDLDSNIYAEKGDKLSRRECMHLIYNMLCSSTKSGKSYASTLGFSTDSQGNIDSASAIASSKNGPYIVKDKNTLSTDIGFSAENATIYKDNKIISFDDINTYDLLYYSKGLDTVWVYSDRVAGIADSFLPDRANPSSVVLSGVTYTLKNGSQAKSYLSGKGQVSEGDAVALILDEKGEAVYASIAQGPFVGKQASLPNIYVNDVQKTSHTVAKDELVYTCTELLSSWYYSTNISGVAQQILPSVENPQSVVIGGKTYSLGENAKEMFKDEYELSEKDFVTAYLRGNTVEHITRADIYDPDIYDDNGLNFASLVSTTLRGPVIVSGNDWYKDVELDTEGATYYDGNTEVSSDSIELYDVLYYSKALRSVWIYSDKVTGTLEEILPDSAAPSSVKVAGATYTLETAAPAIAIAGGSYKKGDVVTLLLGKSGGVCAILSADELASEFFGISLGTEKKEFTSSDGKVSESYYTNVISFDGGTYSIAVDTKDIPSGTLVKVKFENGRQKVSKYNASYSSVSKLSSAVNKGKVAADALIVDYYGTSYKNISPSELSYCKINTKTVKHYELDDDGNIKHLILEDASGDLHSYGVIMNDKGNYTLISEKKNQNVTEAASKTGAVQIKYNGGIIEKVTVLEELQNVTLSDSTVQSGSEEVPIWDYVECFTMKRKNFVIDKEENYSASDFVRSISLDYLRTLADEGSRIFAYRDSAGVVRVLIAI